MNDQLAPALLDEQALPEILSSLENSHFHQQPARTLNYFSDVRESLLSRHVADVERECLSARVCCHEAKHRKSAWLKRSCFLTTSAGMATVIHKA